MKIDEIVFIFGWVFIIWIVVFNIFVVGDVDLDIILLVFFIFINIVLKKVGLFNNIFFVFLGVIFFLVFNLINLLI